MPIPVPVPYFSFTGSRGSKLGDLGPYGKQVMQFYTQVKTVTARWFDDARDQPAASTRPSASSRSTMKIGFIGLGHMGNPMARNLLKHGHALKVYDVVPELSSKLARAGLRGGRPRAADCAHGRGRA